MEDPDKIYPRKGDTSMVYLKPIIKNPMIEIGDYTYYHDSVNNPCEFERRNVLYQAPINEDRLVIGKFCSIAQGAIFMLNCANHNMNSLSSYPFNLLYDLWDLPKDDRKKTWQNRGDIIIGNDVWIGFEAVIMAGVSIGDGCIVGARSIVTKDIPPYTIVAGTPAKEIGKRFNQETVASLLKLQWWNWERTKITKNLNNILSGNISLLENKN